MNQRAIAFRPWDWTRSVIKFLTFTFSALLCAILALTSYRYLLSLGPIPDVIAGNRFLFPWLVIHVAGAATALLLGPLQFIKRLRVRALALHRWIGRVYVVSCLVGGLAGFVLAFGASTGLVSTFGFGLLAIAWVLTTWFAWRRAVQGNFVEHRRWMIRSFALTFAAVMLRLYLPLFGILSFNPTNAYRAVSFLCWVPNLVVAEMYLRRGN